MSKTKKRIIWIVIILVAISGTIMYVRSRKPVVTYTTSDVERGDLKQTVSVTGDLVADEEITLNFEIGGRVGKVFVRESDQVAAGDEIATLTDMTLQKQVDQAKAVLNQAVATAGASSDTIHEADVAVDNAEDVLDDTKDLNDKNIEAAEKAVDNAQDYLDAAQTLYDNSSTDANNLTLVSARNSLNAAEKALKVAKEQAALSKTNAENSVDSAEARLETAKSDFAKASRDASVAQARASYELALDNLNKATLISPVNGIITEVNNKAGEILGTGIIKESFSRVMSLDMIIKSQIPESDIVKIKLGQKAKVTFDALTNDDAFDAEIVEINPASTVVQDVVYYAIKLKLSNFDQRLKPGMSANIDISTAEKNDVLMVPMRAIKTDDNNQKTVDILQDDNTVKTVKVETGLEGDEGMIEITKGLSGNEKVVTFVATK